MGVYMHPHSTTKEYTYYIVFGMDTMLPVEVGKPKLWIVLYGRGEEWLENDMRRK